MSRIVFITLVALFLAPASEAPPPVEAKKLEVPYRLPPTQHIIVRAKINGKGPLNLVLDTGAPLLILAKKSQETLGVKTDDNGWASLDRFELEGGVVIERQTARFEDLYQLDGMNGLGLAGIEIHGLMGYSVLARYRIEFDFSKPKMSWTKLDYEVEELQRSGKAVVPVGLNMLGGMMKSFGKLFGMDQKSAPVYRPFLGLTLVEHDGRLLVDSVLRESPAATASEPLKPGDEITHVNDVSTKTLAAFKKAQAKLHVGEAATIKSLRNGTEMRHEIRPRGGF